MPQLRIAWFSPLPPAGSGIAAYSAELLPLLDGEFTVDRYPEAAAHEFVWRHTRAPYDLTVFQFGNAAWHDYMWAYAATYPGLVILHDARLHHARARQLLKSSRFDDYRREFWYDHPDARREVVEYAVEGLGGPVYYLWRMIGIIVRTARGLAVHNGRVADDLRAEFTDARFDVIRMGVPELEASPAAGIATRRALGIPEDAIVFGAFGKITPEKRVAEIIGALSAVAADVPKAYLLLIGDGADYPSLADQIAASGIASRIVVAGGVPDADLPRHLAAADACLCLRWPTAEETSASWLRCLAARRPTVISDLPHLADVPTILARGWRQSLSRRTPVAISIDLVEEKESLRAAIGRLATDVGFRRELADGGYAYWREHHRLELMADDYRRLIADVAARPVPPVQNLPPHWTDDYSTQARAITAQFGVDVDFLRR